VTREAQELLAPIRALHERVWRAVVAEGEKAAEADLAQVLRDAEGDTIFAIDSVGEDVVVEFLEKEVAPRSSLVLIAEGLPSGQMVLPRGTPEKDAQWRVLVDPIDGTRGWMYQKRSAWILTGVAPNLGADTSLRDITLAVQTEIPLVKQHLVDSVWCARGKGVQGERINRLSGERRPLAVRPSSAKTIEQGFAMLSRFFPGVRDEIAAIDEEIVRGALGPVRAGKAQCFEDQYISTGGQFYELMNGHDRFNADLRPLMEKVLARRGWALGICCHPYDVCSELIAREAGAIITTPEGAPLDARMSVDGDVAWVGYANENIRKQIEPLLRAALRERGLLPGR
jgi:fructose-1,6-bisphosphatase/inositol monophosphatase family enzyme